MYHAATLLVEPFAFGLVCLLLATACLWRRRRGRRRRLIVLTIVVVLLIVSCTELVGNPAIGSLEWRYPADAPLPDKADAIVVLGSSARVSGEDDAAVELDGASVFRCMKAADVYHRAGPCLVVASGGKSRPSVPGPPVARAMKDFLVRLKVDPADIVVEDGSRTTYENAVETWRRLEGRGFERIVLVTDAAHLLRAERCFEAVGCPVTPVGANYRAGRFAWTLETFVPSAGGVSKMQQAFHEWTGLLWYGLQGRL
ncbi:MAG: YdcF family protein [Pirellulales bacterium]|nr:YdcF family protein [Pirellulales bacterium]